jgi:hypothetical protein
VGAQGGALSGPSGLLTVPTAEVLAEGEIRAGTSRHDALAAGADFDNHLFAIGFAPGLEIGGRLTDFPAGLTNDLSLHAKVALRFDNGLALAAGAQDIGGEARNFRSRYAVATLPWRALNFTAGYGFGPDVLDGALAGVEWRPASFIGLYTEYDGDEVNPGLRLRSAPLWGGLRIAANVGHRGATDEVEGGIEFTLPLGRKPAPLPEPQARAVASAPPAGGPTPEAQWQAERPALPPASPLADGAELRAALDLLGFEAVRTGTRDGRVLVVALENRRYNHAAADGIGLALGVIAMRAPPDIDRIELALSAYGAPQVVVGVPAQAYRDFLRDGVAAPALLDVRYGAPDRSVSWHNRRPALRAAELVVEPVLRTFVATEFGMIDAGVGARARFTAPLGHGLIAHIGAQAPIARTDDFRDGGNFEGFGPEASLDQLLIQYVHQPAPAWTSLWSVGTLQVFQVDLRLAGVEQLWTSPEGRHRFNAKLMLLDAAEQHRVALGGYTWFDAIRRYSASVTAGQFYAEDSGARIDVQRYFGDTIAGVFLKVQSDDSMAGGFQMSVPLTPRRDRMPDGVQVKGARRWGHSLQTTLNLADGSNALRPLMLYEPVTDLDLRRDFLDSNRLGPAFLRGELARLREAYLLWGSP